MSATYSFDQIIIHCRNDLKVALCRKLKGEGNVSSLDITSVRADSEAYKSGYRTRINIVAPTNSFLRNLRKILKNEKTAITKLEIAEDVRVDSLAIANNEVETLSRTICKRWGKDVFIYDQNERRSDKTPEPDKGKITAYFDAQKQFSVIVYSRLSKRQGAYPCVRKEFRIHGSRRIKEKTGIKTISDIIAIKPKEVFEKLRDKYIYHQNFDWSEQSRIKIGRLALGVHGNTKSERLPDSAPFRERLTCLHSRLMLASGIIESAFADSIMNYHLWKRKALKNKKQINKENKCLYL